MAENRFSLLDKNNVGTAAFAGKDKRGYKELLSLLGAFFVSFCFSGFSAVEEISPFGISFLAAVPFDFCFVSLLGGAFGYLIAQPWQTALRYCGALVVCCGLKLIARKRLTFLDKKAVMPFFSLFGTLLSGGIYYLIGGISLASALLLIGEVILAFCCCSLFVRAVNLLFLAPSEGISKTKDSVFLVCSLCLFLLCMSSYTVKGISAGRIAAYGTVMLFALFKGVSGGSVSGICIGAFLSLQPGFVHIFPSLAVGGLAAGVMSSFGQLICGISFCGAAVFASLSGGIDRELFISLAEIFTAFIAVAVVPASKTEELKEFIGKRGLIKDEKIDRQVAHILTRASDNISQVCEIVNSVSDRLRKEGENEKDGDILSQMKIAEMQRILTDQFGGISEFLGELAVRVRSRRIPDSSKAAALRAVLRDGGIYTDDVGWFKDTTDAITVEITLIDRPFDINWKKAKRIIEFFCKKSFERPEVEVTQLKTVLTFCQKHPYRLQIGFSQKAAVEGAVCGDCVSAAAKLDSRGFVLISDGMGTGPSAATDSRMTAAIMKKLICSGFSFDSALKIVNSALIARCGEESIASIDGIEADLISGEVVFYKAGASCSFVRKGDRIATLEKKSLPLGILRNVGFSKAKFIAQAGDIILLVSDGVVQKDEDWICDELLSWSTNNMEDLSMHILKLASLRQNKQEADDMTVVAVKIESNKKDTFKL